MDGPITHQVSDDTTDALAAPNLSKPGSQLSAEKNGGGNSSQTNISASFESKHGWDISRLVRKSWSQYKFVWALAIWAILTGYFIASLALKRMTQLSDILPFIFLYAFVSGKMLFAFIGTSFLTRPLSTASQSIQSRAQRIPLRLRYLLGAVVLVAIVLSVSLTIPENNVGRRIDRMQSFLGIIIILLVMTATSTRPRSIQWRTVYVGLLLQFCLGCIVIKTKWGNDFFTWLASMASGLLDFANYGTKFLLGDSIGSLDIFVITVFPAVIFFSAFIQVVQYLGGIQWIIKKLGWAFQQLLGTSGTESMVAAASPFLGISENVLLVKDYIEHMTCSELHACMTAGFATISGSTLQGYIAMGVDAKNIITACVMSIPCSLALSKLRYPETEESLTRGVMVDPPRNTDEANILHALANGAAIGINLSLLISANLIAIIALVNLIDFLLTWLGQFVTIHQLTLELILGYVLYPYAWLLGVPHKDILNVSQLLGLKFITNEFVAYQRLTGETNGPALKTLLSSRGLAIAEFALCGFGNLGSIAIEIGVMSALAPSRKTDISRLVLSACITGSIATTITAAIVSMVM
ncbi:hypothetical protein IW146_002162 [Coemansia sp. RSA 922]|nr:hypothetical protein LPJ71_008273 [Coemansia sp. S17]KAJ2017615.1 hypothetical protein GGI14_002869 [Coemansia sp. S680]KAJ2067221.1 hypothetical protein GGH13_005399 [Coemansia sp. S155-1]KAJ2115630.1 hypothetical protein IW146_002162 [Coemansia sp. RSA 922]